MSRIDLSDLKIIKKELYEYLSEDKFNYYTIAQFSINFKKNLKLWEEENKNNFNNFKKKYKKIKSKLSYDILSDLAKISYYKKKLTKQEAYNFLKELNDLEKILININSFNQPNIYKKTG